MANNISKSCLPLFTLKKQHFRTIFISDFHIGAKSFNASSLLDFLKHTESEKLYLVGDIIDGWKLSKRWIWNETINQIFDELVRKASQGTEIIYVPGNHDDAVRYVPVLKRIRFARRMGIKIANTLIHKTADDRRFIVLHGDQFDTRILSEPVLKTHHKISNFFGELFVFFRKESPMIEIDGTMKKFSLAKYLSRHGRTAIQTLNNFEGLVYELVKSKKLDGIICGHTHIPVLKKIKDITYANTGSWLRSGNTALVEDVSGNLSLLDWDNVRNETHSEKAEFYVYQNDFFGTEQNIYTQPSSLTYRPITNFIVKKIKKVWGPKDAVYPVYSQQSLSPEKTGTLLKNMIYGVSDKITLSHISNMHDRLTFQP